MVVPDKDRIVVVDHDLASRGFLRECLEQAGYFVIPLSNGLQLDPLRSGGGFCVFILNVDTPRAREKDLIRKIRKTPSTRILLIVSERRDAFLKEATDLGVYGFLYKPFNPREVCTMVRHLVR